MLESLYDIFWESNLLYFLVALGIILAIVGRIKFDLGWIKRTLNIEEKILISDKKVVAELKRIHSALDDLTVSMEKVREKEGTLVKPLLLVMADYEFGETDRNAIRRARIPFHRLREGTSVAFDAELRRRRRDRSLYVWIHISAHMGPEGVKFADRTVDPLWLCDRLDGVKIVFLAGCQSVEVADVIAGVVDFVVSTYEDIEDSVAGDFAYAFWSRISEGEEPYLAYSEAIQEVPTVSEYVEMRRR